MMGWACRIIPPGWLLLALLLQWALHRWLPIAQVLALPLRAGGLALLAGGTALALAGVGAFRRARTPIVPFEHSTALVTSGVYRYTRNPMYLGLTLVLAGTAVLLGSIGAFLPVPLFVWIIDRGYVRAEERFLEQIFGGDYSRYRSAVRRWL
jgi:protein-S-isoprenylcysteine O-methyltransferase Ste14